MVLHASTSVLTQVPRFCARPSVGSPCAFSPGAPRHPLRGPRRRPLGKHARFSQVVQWASVSHTRLQAVFSAAPRTPVEIRQTLNHVSNPWRGQHLWGPGCPPPWKGWPAASHLAWPCLRRVCRDVRTDTRVSWKNFGGTFRGLGGQGCFPDRDIESQRPTRGKTVTEEMTWSVGVGPPGGGPSRTTSNSQGKMQQAFGVLPPNPQDSLILCPWARR